MINGLEMITNRTQSDVTFAKSMIKKGWNNLTDDEKDLFLRGLKGAYNYTDFNRVGEATSYLAEFLSSLPQELKNLAEELGVYWVNNIYGVSYNPSDYDGISLKHDWSYADILTKKYRSEYLQTIQYVLMAFIDVSNDFPDRLEGLTHIGANAIEQGLVDLYEFLVSLKEEKENFIKGTAKSWFESGEIYGGES